MASQHASFMCHMDFTNFVIVCFEAAMQYYNMHHLCVLCFLQFGYCLL